MNPRHENEWERCLHDELRRLPRLAAPDDLAERVLRRLESRRNAPWWRKSLWSWPPMLRRLAMVFFITLASAMSLGLAMVNVESFVLIQALSTLAGALFHEILGLMTFADRMETLLAAPAARTWLMLGLVFAAAYLTVIGLGSVFWQVAGRAKRGT